MLAFQTLQSEYEIDGEVIIVSASYNTTKIQSTMNVQIK
jgi:hypothetical protein